MEILKLNSGFLPQKARPDPDDAYRVRLNAALCLWGYEMSTDIKSALKSASLLIREYVKRLEAENAKLQKNIAKLECDEMSNKHKINELKKELDKCLKKGHLIVNVNRNIK